MTYGYHLREPKPMCEIKINQLLHKNPKTIYSPNRFTIYPFNQEHAYNLAPKKLNLQIQEFEHEYLNTITFKFSI